jgi:predicted dehydrogenase
MLDSENLDAVWICTPPTVRREPLLLCADRGVPALCEKPAATDEKAAEDIAVELENQDAKVMVGYPFRGLPTVATLRAVSADDRIHGVQSLYLCDVSLTMGLRPWFYDREKSGGAMVDQATHVFDLLRTVLGEVAEVRALGSNPIRRKSAGYTVDEVIGLAMRYESGAVGTHTHSWVADTWRTEISFCGEQRMYRLDLTGGSLTVLEDDVATTHSYRGGLYRFENARFVDMVASGDWSGNLCTYRDATKTLALTLRCNQELDR